ncbi:MAG: ABC transporter permease [Geodermatophilaceae bacterium]|nr:ABC transporter permease [Geodermatophilaceae bacterium]
MVPLTSSVATVVAAEAPNPWFSSSYLRSNYDTILSALGEHVILTVVSVLVGAVVAMPLALIARRSKLLSTFVLGGSTVVYTIPSLAMFAFVYPFTGLSRETVIVGLVLYSLVILVRNFLAGLQAVPADVREAALGMGYGPARMLLLVEIPMALPTFFAGLRIATVSTVALVTVGVIVGHGGLGNILISGFNSNFFRAPIAAAALLTVLLALTLDLVLATVARVLTPWARGRAA